MTEKYNVKKKLLKCRFWKIGLKKSNSKDKLMLLLSFAKAEG